MVKKQHGGKRTGAGRKSDGDQPKVVTSIRVSREFAAFLATLNRSVWLEKIGREQKEFKQWSPPEP